MPSSPSIYAIHHHFIGYLRFDPFNIYFVCFEIPALSTPYRNLAYTHFGKHGWPSIPLFIYGGALTPAPQSSKRQCMQCKGYEMRGSTLTSSCQYGGMESLSNLYNNYIITEKIFTWLKIKICTRIIRESDNFLHIISFNIHFFERTPLKHVEKKHGFDL